MPVPPRLCAAQAERSPARPREGAYAARSAQEVVRATGQPRFARASEPVMASTSSAAIAPGRRSIGSGSNATIVDSIPHSVSPSMTRSIASPSASKTCEARVGLNAPKGFALGAASGSPVAAISARATGCEGIRTPTVGNPAGYQAWHEIGFAQHNGQRPRPETFGKTLRERWKLADYAQ